KRARMLGRYMTDAGQDTRRNVTTVLSASQAQFSHMHGASVDSITQRDGHNQKPSAGSGSAQGFVKQQAVRCACRPLTHADGASLRLAGEFGVAQGIVAHAAAN
ncbi:MAG TPA: hypothetical protein VIU38_03230, partial [Anaerolineales bacterium]